MNGTKSTSLALTLVISIYANGQVGSHCWGVLCVELCLALLYNSEPCESHLAVGREL